MPANSRSLDSETDWQASPFSPLKMTVQGKEANHVPVYCAGGAGDQLLDPMKMK